MRRSRPPRPPWWPEGEHFPPGERGLRNRAWSPVGRRIRRYAVLWFVLVIVVPIVVGLVLAVAVGGWTSVAIAAVTWLGLATAIILAARFGVRSWQPIRSLIEAADRLADGDHTARATSIRRTPVEPLLESFNAMAHQLEASTNERRRLLSDVGHEIRTPLMILRGELEAMVDGVRPTDADALRRLLDDVDMMQRLLDDLSTLSTAEAGALAIYPEPTSLVNLVDSTVADLTALAVGGNVELIATTPDTRVVADVDPVRVREILLNLIRNALRATPNGGRVSVSLTSDAEAATIRVGDTGPGIPSSELDRVFDRFHKGPGSAGSGLGLTISRNLARAHGGEVVLESEVGFGTTATVRLPLERSGPAAT